MERFPSWWGITPTNPTLERLRDVKLFIELRNSRIGEAEKLLKLRQSNSNASNQADKYLAYYQTLTAHRLNLIKNNVFYNYIFIYYRKNHKCNIYIYIYINFVVSNENNIIFLKNSKGKLAKIFIFQ